MADTLKLRTTHTGGLHAELPDVALHRATGTSWPVIDLKVLQFTLSPATLRQLDSILADVRVREALRLDARPVALAKLTNAQRTRTKSR